MGDYLDMIWEAVLRVASITNPEGWAIAGIGMLVVGIYAFFKSQTYGDWVVGKRKVREIHRAQLNKDQDQITEAFQSAVTRLKMTQEDADKYYALMNKACPNMKELGPEPAFGRPWYKGPAPSKNSAEVKSSIIHRLQNMGVNTHELWNKKKRIMWARITHKKTAEEDMADLMKAIHKHKV